MKTKSENRKLKNGKQKMINLKKMKKEKEWAIVKQQLE